MSHRKMSAFVSFPLFGFNIVMKLGNFDFESHWNTLIFFDKKTYGVRFEYVPWKMSDFFSFSFFGFNLVIDLKNFDFENQIH